MKPYSKTHSQKKLEELLLHLKNDKLLPSTLYEAKNRANKDSLALARATYFDNLHEHIYYCILWLFTENELKSLARCIARLEGSDYIKVKLNQETEIELPGFVLDFTEDYILEHLFAPLGKKSPDAGKFCCDVWIKRYKIADFVKILRSSIKHNLRSRLRTLEPVDVEKDKKAPKNIKRDEEKNAKKAPLPLMISTLDKDGKIREADRRDLLVSEWCDPTWDEVSFTNFPEDSRELHLFSAVFKRFSNSPLSLYFAFKQLLGEINVKNEAFYLDNVLSGTELYVEFEAVLNDLEEKYDISENNLLSFFKESAYHIFTNSRCKKCLFNLQQLSTDKQKEQKIHNTLSTMRKKLVDMPELEEHLYISKSKKNYIVKY